MAERCLLYYITDRTQFRGNEADRRRALLGKISEAARCGIDYIQLRERDLSTREMEGLAREVMELIREARTNNDPPAAPTQDDELRTENRELRTETHLLINSRADVALAVGADGVHLRSEDVPASTARSIWNKVLACSPRIAARKPMIAVSCHAPTDVVRAASEGADFVVFAPVFGKQNRPQVRPTGLDMLHEACTAAIPVLALGGVSVENAASCLQAGAAGIAGIRVFQENDLATIVPALRATMRTL